MIVTELQAWEQICTMPVPKFRKLCEGSNCMAWRWADPEKRGDARRGYCGMAGPPLFAIVKPRRKVLHANQDHDRMKETPDAR